MTIFIDGMICLQFPVMGGKHGIVLPTWMGLSWDNNGILLGYHWNIMYVYLYIYIMELFSQGFQYHFCSESASEYLSHYPRWWSHRSKWMVYFKSLSRPSQAPTSSCRRRGHNRSSARDRRASGSGRWAYGDPRWRSHGSPTSMAYNLV